MMRHFVLRTCTAALLLLAFAASGAAQTGSGQLCLRAFEDRNANGRLDPGEPLITRGISANLANADGIIIQTELIDDSPQAAQGILCFQRLEAGQYTLSAASADYSPTTNTAFVTSVAPNSIPQVFDLGLQVIVAVEPTPTADSDTLTAQEQRRLLERLFLSGLGTAIVIAGMIALGSVVYYLFVRPKPKSQAYSAYIPPSPTGTGRMPAVPTPSHPMPPVSAAAVTPPPMPRVENEPPTSDEDTGRYRPQQE